MIPFPQIDPDLECDPQAVARKLRRELKPHVEFLLFLYTSNGKIRSLHSEDDTRAAVPHLRRWLAAIGDVETFDRPHSAEGLALERLVAYVAKHEGIPDPLEPERRVDAVLNRLRFIRERYAKDVPDAHKLIADPELSPREGTVPDVAITFLRAIAKAYNEGDTDGLNAVITRIPRQLL